MEDALLIRRIKQGDEAAFDELVRRHYDSIYAFCYRRCADRAAPWSAERPDAGVLRAAGRRIRRSGPVHHPDAQ